MSDLEIEQSDELPEPFLTHQHIEDLLSYPYKNSNNDIKFVVDESKTCARVQAALSDASNVFAHKGAIKEPNQLWEPSKWMPLFHGALSDEEQQAVTQALVRKELPIDALLKVATPASFGKDGETVFDSEVRKAFEIPRSRLPSDLLGVLHFSSIEGVEQTMKPVSKKWTYHLYKIHMYGPGGKFEDHADTLHKSNHVATVVLSLPSEHVGGILRVQHHGEEMEFDSSKGPIQDRYYAHANLRLGAFFTDCTHSVQEVVSGWRVVVQYDVYEESVKEEVVTTRRSPSPVRRVIECLDDNRTVGTTKIHDKEQTELIQALSQYMAKIPPADGVAFFLRHRYSLPALNEVVLKGADRTIYDAFSKRADWSVSVQGVLAYIETEDEAQIAVEVKAVSINDFVPPSDGNEEENPSTTDKSDGSSTATGGNRKRKQVGTVHLIVDKNNGAVRVHKTGGHLGNEMSDDYTSYFAACMIIRPTVEESRRPIGIK
jgi:hypothetical protein